MKPKGSARVPPLNSSFHLSGAVGRYATVQPNLWEGCILNSFLKERRVVGRGVERARPPNLLASLLPPAAVSEKCGCQEEVRVGGRARAHPTSHLPPTTVDLAEKRTVVRGGRCGG